MSNLTRRSNIDLIDNSSKAIDRSLNSKVSLCKISSRLVSDALKNVNLVRHPQGSRKAFSRHSRGRTTHEGLHFTVDRYLYNRRSGTFKSVQHRATGQSIHHNLSNQAHIHFLHVSNSRLYQSQRRILIRDGNSLRKRVTGRLALEGYQPARS